MQMLQKLAAQLTRSLSPGGLSTCRHLSGGVGLPKSGGGDGVGVDDGGISKEFGKNDHPVIKEGNGGRSNGKLGTFSGLTPDFPCIVGNPSSGPEPTYASVPKNSYRLFEYPDTFCLELNSGRLPGFKLAYETWGSLNPDASNAILLCTGLSASSHARSHPLNPAKGWWESFIGPGCALDTDKFFIICANLLGSCFGSSGPSSVNPETGDPYATTFPVVSVTDLVRSQFLLLDQLGIQRLHAAVGSSLGGMLSLASAVEFPDRVNRLISISSASYSHPTSIAMRYLQRKAIMTDPHWRSGRYYGSDYPKTGMKLAREIATLTYRSGPEWETRFGRRRLNPAAPQAVSLCPTFVIEQYLDYQGEASSVRLDPNSLLYLSKAMDLFDAEDQLDRVICPAMILGVQSDILFPVEQQRQLAQRLRDIGRCRRVTYFELTSLYGHDTFLLDVHNVGTAVKGFLETEHA
ncbi:hypothetical protein BOX15_Mlig006020g4 [Macrostomum lignano]|uniref:AB hydrolase-1 domain-containing protein n=1 Tax=Macrostomum lignano TaxID=282301 RepID=A0A267EX88_9PLAT|nr:hypothetical protein BOX15_Mlig006020g4 [Macrostomum lignano]